MKRNHWNLDLKTNLKGVKSKTDLPNTMTKVILTVLIFARGMMPRELALLSSDSSTRSPSIQWGRSRYIQYTYVHNKNWVKISTKCHFTMKT